MAEKGPKKATPKVEVAEAPEQVEEQELRVSYEEYELQYAEILDDENLTDAEKAAEIVLLTNSLEEGNGRKFAKIQHDIRHEVLPELIGEKAYREYGREIAHALRNGAIDLAVLGNNDEVPQLAQLPEEVREEVVNRFVDGRLIGRNKDGSKISIGRIKNALRGLEMGDMDTARYVRRIFAKETPTVSSLDDVEKLYDEHDAERRVYKVRIPTDKPGAAILPINELRLGHQDGKPGIRLAREWAAKLKATPAEEQPSVILVSALLQGDFSHSQSNKRASLVTGMANMKNQFASAKMILDELRATGIPVIHTLGPDDHRLARDYTLDVMNELRDFARGSHSLITYYNQNQLQESDEFQEHKKFQLQYMLPLCYHLGRRLRSADEMSQQTDGEITRSEYLMLYDHIVLGQPIHPALGLDEESLKGLGEWYDNTVVVDDADIIIETPEHERYFRYRHVETPSPDTISANTTEIQKKMLGNLGTNGYRLPDATISGRGQEATSITSSGRDVLVLPGMTDPRLSLESSQYYRMIPGDASLRANATRKRLWTPTMNEFGIDDNGDVWHRYINKKILDKADSLPRTAVFELCDIQKGSPTSRSDYFVQYLSYILETAERMPVVIQWAGDIIQGHIYPGFSDESQSIGLIRLKSQKLAIEDMLMKAWGHPDIPRTLLDGVIDILVQQGNHDEQQRRSETSNSDSNIDYLIHTQQKIFDRRGQETKVRHNAIYHTSTGTPVPTWMGTTHVGAYTIKTAHYHILKGMKGNTGGLPLHHPYMRAQGHGEEEKADILMGAHWHNRQSGMVGDKLIVIGGAMAERSEFEDMLGYDAKLSGTVVFVGGGEPIEVRNIHAENFNRRPVKYGYFTPENLAAEGYFDDPGFDPTRHAQYSRGMPKSAIQKALNDSEMAASQLAIHEAEIDNPNIYDENGRPVSLNKLTERAFARARKLQLQARKR